MSLTYVRSDVKRLIVVSAIDAPHPVSLEETLSIIDRQWGEGTWEYALLCDYRDTAYVPTEEHLARIRRRIDEVSGGQRRGPVALIATRPSLVRMALLYAERAHRGGSLELLITSDQIQQWLSRHAERPR